MLILVVKYFKENAYSSGKMIMSLKAFMENEFITLV